MDYSDINIEWQSEITARVSGYSFQARRMLKPLIEGGAKIKLIPDEDYLPPHMKLSDPFWDEQIKKSKEMPEAPLRVCYALPTRFKPDPKKITVGYSMWETNKYPKQWVDTINRTCDYFFAGCEALVGSAKKGGVTIPIFPVNATLDVKEWNPEGHKLRINEIPDDSVKFLFVGNFIPRKNLEQLLLGFAVAFEGVPDASLIIKTWAHGNDAKGKKHIAEAIRHLLNRATGLSTRPKVSVIADILDEDRMRALVRSCDVYTSVSKGEGFDLPMVQAMSMEKLIVTTRFLAHNDYLDDTNSIDVPYSLTPCVEAAAPLYDSYQMWSAPDMEVYISSLRKAYEEIKAGSPKGLGKNARTTIQDLYSSEVNTPKIANIIREIRDGKHKPHVQTTKEVVKNLVH